MVSPQRLEEMDGEAFAHYHPEMTQRQPISNGQNREESKPRLRAECRQNPHKAERRTMRSRFSTDYIARSSSREAADGKESPQKYNELFTKACHSPQTLQTPLQFEFKLVLPAPTGTSLGQMESDITLMTNFLAKTTMEYYKLAHTSCSSFLSQCTPSISLNMSAIPNPVNAISTIPSFGL